MATNKIKSGVSYDILAVPEIQLLFKSLSSEGAEVFLVGGCVRDSVLGLPSSDFDLATNALPSEVLKLCKKFRFKTVKTGVSHGTVSVVFAESLFQKNLMRLMKNKLKQFLRCISFNYLIKFLEKSTALL